MANYISKKDQERIEELLKEYWRMDDLQKTSETVSIEEAKKYERKKNLIFNEIYKHINKLILGVINSGQYAFYRFGEVEDLQSYAAMKVFESIEARQWNSEKGSVFNFFTAVVARNLYSYTTSMSKKKMKYADIDLTKIPHEEHFVYTHDYDKDFVIEYIFSEMDNFFADKKKFQDLLEVFKVYYKINSGKKFIKKKFIDFAKTYCFSRSFVNTFFNHCKKIKTISQIVNEMYSGNER